MLTLTVRGLPREATEQTVTELFNGHGRVRNLKMARDVFSGQSKGFAEIQMEGHEARAAIAALNGMSWNGAMLRVELKTERSFGRR